MYKQLLNRKRLRSTTYPKTLEMKRILIRSTTVQCHDVAGDGCKLWVNDEHFETGHENEADIQFLLYYRWKMLVTAIVSIHPIEQFFFLMTSHLLIKHSIPVSPEHILHPCKYSLEHQFTQVNILSSAPASLWCATRARTTRSSREVSILSPCLTRPSNLPSSSIPLPIPAV